MPTLEPHARLLSSAIEKALGPGETGTLAYVRCLPSDVAERVVAEVAFAPRGWAVWRVAGVNAEYDRTTTADRAVEIREAKGVPTLFVVDTSSAGAGMDGIYSSGREVTEAELFGEALRIARREVTRSRSRELREFAEAAVKVTRRRSRRLELSPWAEFDFLVRMATENVEAGSLVHLLGLWPVKRAEDVKDASALEVAAKLVSGLLGSSASGLPPAQRIARLGLQHPSEDQAIQLRDFLRGAASKPLADALQDLTEMPGLWVNALRLESEASAIEGIDIVPWRGKDGRLVSWSGLSEATNAPPGGNEPPQFVLSLEAPAAANYSRLEARWKARPEHLEKGSVDYRVAIMTDMDEEVAAKEVSHSAGNHEKCRFTNDDFATLGEDALIPAKVVVSVAGTEVVEESEEFVILFGEPQEREKGGMGKNVRACSEGLLELGSRDAALGLFEPSGMGVAAGLQSPGSFSVTEAKGHLVVRTPEKGKSFRVYQPALIREIERLWPEQGSAIGRWRVKVRGSGTRVGSVEFVPFQKPQIGDPSLEAYWERAAVATRRFQAHLGATKGTVAQCYDDQSRWFDAVVKEYMLAWAALLEQGRPELALVNTVEVQALSGRLLGLIVLPSHPLRVAWHVAYDNLALHARFAEGVSPSDARGDLSALDGALFPAFLPRADGDGTFVFADMLSFHAVAMVLDRDSEPKASVALLARAIGDVGELGSQVPTVGNQSAQVLGQEIVRYVESHYRSSALRVHALRAGDGFTVARALGFVHKHFEGDEGEADDLLETGRGGPCFMLEFFPSQEQRGIAGRFIAEAREKRRTGTGVVASEDHWMLESVGLPGGLSTPRLRWARKSEDSPRSAAHLAVGFDTFDSRVTLALEGGRASSRPAYAFGLLSFFERVYSGSPSPLWCSRVPPTGEGEKHPSDRTHSERLFRMQQAVHRCVARGLGDSDESQPELRTEISPERGHALRSLHELCDWVITLDRNAGIEYFDSPKDDREMYDAYVIDCIPEREDLGCLQLITSTSNLAEVRILLDRSLDQMGLSQSRRNAEFLLENLKALSGHLAIRLTGQGAPAAELVALALCSAHCRFEGRRSEAWPSLTDGYFVPVDDVRDLLPPLSSDGHGQPGSSTRPDLIHVSIAPRRGLLFRFVEVKYRRHLRIARSQEVLDQVLVQVESARKRWEKWYGMGTDGSLHTVARAIRRAKLARVLRFYADKARRHHLEASQHARLLDEIDRMVSTGAGYSFASVGRCDRGLVFCPEYSGLEPVEISPLDWETRVFLYGPSLLPDSEFRLASMIAPEPGVGYRTNAGDAPVAPGTEGQRCTQPDSLTPAQPHGEAATQEPAIMGTQESESEAVQLTEVSIALGTAISTQDEVLWNPSVKGNPHLMVVGLPGMGKTTCLLSLCRQMLQHNIRPIVFSYHQDIDERLQETVASVRFIDFDGLGFNPLRVIERETPRAYLDVAGAMRDIFSAIYPELGDIQCEKVRQSIKQSFLEKGWDNPEAERSALQEPAFGRFLEILRATPKPDRGLQTLLARLDELADYGFFELRQELAGLWEAKGITVIRIHGTQNDNLQRAFASLVFYGLYKDMFRRGTSDSLTHSVIFDEAHRAAGLKLIPRMAKECRKYGVSLVVASQEARDFNVSLFSAIANYLVLRLTDVDAKALVRNVASSDQERALVDRIKQLDRFKALYFCEGKRRPASVALMQ